MSSIRIYFKERYHQHVNAPDIKICINGYAELQDDKIHIPKMAWINAKTGDVIAEDSITIKRKDAHRWKACSGPE